MSILSCLLARLLSPWAQMWWSMLVTFQAETQRKDSFFSKWYWVKQKTDIGHTEDWKLYPTLSVTNTNSK